METISTARLLCVGVYINMVNNCAAYGCRSGYLKNTFGFACETNTIRGFTRFTKLISVLQMKHLVSLNWYGFLQMDHALTSAYGCEVVFGCRGSGLIGLVVV